MKTEKFTELTVGYYKLVDKGGWFGCHPVNRSAYEERFEGDLIFIEECLEGVGCCEDRYYIIGAKEYHYFEKVVVESRVRSQEVDVSYSSSIRIGGGEHFLPILSIAHLPFKEKFYFVQHISKSLPDGNTLLSNKEVRSSDFHSREIPQYIASTVQEAVEEHEKVKGHHLVPFSFLVGYCMAKGVDLYKEGLVEL